MPNWCINRVEAAPEVLRHVTKPDGWIDLSIVDEALHATGRTTPRTRSPRRRQASRCSSRPGSRQ